jgi:uncharacterized protein (DUF1810 family)
MTVAGASDNGNLFDLQRFVDAQRSSYLRACKELRAGQKTSHWIWYVFPQLKGLGFSSTAQMYAIGSLAEARAYLAHPLLGPRLEEATRLMLALRGRELEDILGHPDDLKFRSCMTLFAAAAGPGSNYETALDTLCGGIRDEKTLALIERGESPG